MKVGAVIISHDHKPFLPERIRSVSSQDFKDVALYGYDDHSIDGSSDVLRLSGVQMLRFGPKLGRPLLVWQRILDTLENEYLWFAEGDDSCSTGLLEKCVHLLESDERIGMAYCQSSLVSATGETLEETPSFLKALHPDRWDQAFVLGGEDAVKLLFSARNTVPNASACVFRRQALLDAGLDSIPYQLCGDWLAYARLARTWKIAYIPQKLNLYRVHSGTVRASSEKNGVRMRETYQVQAEIAKMCPLSSDEWERGALASFSEWMHSMDQADRRTRRYLDSDEFATLAASFDARFRERKDSRRKFVSPCLEVYDGWGDWLRSARRYYPIPWGLEACVSIQTRRQDLWWRLTAPAGSDVKIELSDPISPHRSVLIEEPTRAFSLAGWRRLVIPKRQQAAFRVHARLP